MSAKTISARRAESVVQFSVFTPNRLGCLRDLVGLLESQSVHVLGLTVLDTTDSSIIRVVVDDPGKAGELLRIHDFPFTQSELVVVEVTSADELNRLTSIICIPSFLIPTESPLSASVWKITTWPSRFSSVTNSQC
jgi:hypothetical protein